MTKPLAIYYEVLNFMPSSLAMLRDRFELAVFPDPDHADPAVQARAEAVFAPKGFALDAAALSRHPVLGPSAPHHWRTAHRRERRPGKGRNRLLAQARARTAALHLLHRRAGLGHGPLPDPPPAEAWTMFLEGRWEGRNIGARTPHMLSNMRLGVIGLGRLGALVAGYGRAFGMEVRYYDPFVDDSRYIRRPDVLEVARESDVVSVHVHKTPETDRFLDAAFFQAMPTGSFFVNTANGEVVDEAALLEALRSGHLAGAAVDTLAGDYLAGFVETLPGNPMQQYAEQGGNLLLFPRYGGCTTDAWELTEHSIINAMANACAKEDRP